MTKKNQANPRRRTARQYDKVAPFFYRDRDGKMHVDLRRFDAYVKTLSTSEKTRLRRGLAGQQRDAANFNAALRKLTDEQLASLTKALQREIARIDAEMGRRQKGGAT